MRKILNWFKRKPEPRPFTGTCPVRQHTADGAYVGRCWHSTYDSVCPLHGQVRYFLGDDADLTYADDRLIIEPPTPNSKDR